MNPHARLNSLHHQPHIEITGAVPSPVPYLQAADAFVIPMRVGGGTRFKALEAMAARKAIVSTALGVEGIGVQAEREMLIADTPAAFAAAILRLIADRREGASLAHRLGQAAHEFVAARYTWDQIVPIFDQLYVQLRAGHQPNSTRPLVPAVKGAQHDQRGVQP
jgi:glycosyltransferase involved in cell wall biosynthesis